ncbi:MAG: AAA family ATPase [Bacteroidales bacterium]|nr:AAA family ATPase [Bacteroidales bacterium]
MLARFAVKNYRGFKDKIELDLSHPANYEFNNYAIKNGIVKNGIIYGPNGSGKTNLGLAIFDIVNHLTQNHKNPDYYQNFVYVGCPNEYIDFEYIFHFNHTELQYCYSKDAKGVLKKESLKINKDITPIFSRDNNSLDIDERYFVIGEDMKKQLTTNANNVSILGFILMYYPLSNDSFLIKLKDFVDSMLWFRSLRFNEFIGLESGTTLLEQFIITNEYMEDFQIFLERVSGQKFHFINNSKDDKQLLCEIEGKPILFDVICSVGTEALLLLYCWIKKIDKASFVFIDEFDAFYHFKLSVEVCKLLFEKDCQLFLSSHNTYLMANSLLRPDCNFIICDNKIKSLNICTDKDLRFGHNIEKLYRGNIFNI